MTSIISERRYNSDILLAHADRELAQQQFPKIYHILDHPELRNKFSEYDKIANTKKRVVQRYGLAAVLLATIALLSSALNPFISDQLPTWIHTTSLIAEIAGIIGVLIATGGLWFGRPKREWLKARLMSEILRQWYFELLICRSSEIDASCDSTVADAQETFRRSRAIWFEAFVRDYEGSLDSYLEDMINKPETGYEFLHDPMSHCVSSPVREEIFAAYKQLRFKHQRNYATYQLLSETDKPLWKVLSWPAKVLQERLEKLASACLLLSLCASTLIIVGHFAHFTLPSTPPLPAVIVILMILNVAIREVGAGLTAPESLERYHDYAEKIRYLLTRFDESSNAEKKFNLMEEMERAALEELKGFLRAHHNAKFII